MRFLVLDNGFVDLDAVLGSDEDVVRIARITTMHSAKKFQSTERLIRRLWLDGHTSPFGFPQVRLYVRAPLVVLRQWFRHRTAVRNEVPTHYESEDYYASAYHEMQEYSGRYAVYANEFYLPTKDQMVKQSTDNHQGSSDIPLSDNDSEFILENMQEEQRLVARNREEYVRAGLERGRARINTPLSQYTEFYWQQSLLNMLHWLGLRRSTDSQYEIRAYAEVVQKIIAERFPITYKVWQEDVDGVKLHKPELDELRNVLDGITINEMLRCKLFKGVEDAFAAR